MKKLKAILIDTENREVKMIEIEKGIDAIYEQINCDCFTVVTLENEDAIFVDDEGLLKLNENSKFFFIEGYHQPLAGNGLILGTDEEGESVNAKSNLEDIKNRVKFLTIQEIHAINPEWLSQFL
jgi:hypothetical protein